MRFDPTIAWDWLQANAATLATTGVVLAGIVVLVVLALDSRINAKAQKLSAAGRFRRAKLALA